MSVKTKASYAFYKRSDECGRVFVYRTNGTRFQPGHTQTTKHSGRKTIGVWAWFTAEGAGSIHRIVGRLNAEKYIDVLEDSLIPSAWAHYGLEPIPFVQDRSPIHTSHVVTEWFQGRPEFNLLPWPAKGADLNPIENVWSDMVRELQHIQVMHQEELWTAVSEIWARLKRRNHYWRTLTN